MSYIPFVVTAALLQCFVFILLVIFSEYDQNLDARVTGRSNFTGYVNNLVNVYPYFQDVQGMIFLGFGFLMTFLKKYGYSSVGINFFISAISLQWALVLNGFVASHGKSIPLDGVSLINAEFATATILISFGVVLGKTSPLQLLLMSFIEMPLFVLNEYIGRHLLKVTDVGDSIFVHTFGAYFGLFLSRAIYKKSMGENKNEGSVYHSDIFAMIGTLVLWMFWPSFNSGGIEGDRRHRAVINTFCALIGSTILTFIVSAFVEKGKINMVHVANATLSGGVAVGASADLMLKPWGACLVGMIAGTASTLGYKYITPRLNKIGFHDTCGVNNLHGMPGLIAGVVVTVASALATEEIYGTNILKIFEARSTRSAGQQAGYQIAALLVTVGIASISGLLTGILLRIKQIQPPKDKYFEDSPFWEVPSDYVDQYTQPSNEDVELQEKM